MTGIVSFRSFRLWLSSFSPPYRFCKIKHMSSGSLGVCLVLGESISSAWKSSDIIVHWTDGEHSIPCDEDIIEILDNDLFGHYTTEQGEEIDD